MNCLCVFEGVAALGSNYISVGIHTGTIILFRVTMSSRGVSSSQGSNLTLASSQQEEEDTTTMSAFHCQNVDSQRCHVYPITDLASTSTLSTESKEVLIS